MIGCREEALDVLLSKGLCDDLGRRIQNGGDSEEEDE